MITALIRADRGAEALAVTLGALVPGVIDGLVGEAIVLTRRQDGSLSRITDAVGADLVIAGSEPFREGARHAKRDWLLCLADGDVPGEGWIQALDRFVSLSPADRRFGRLLRPSASLRERLARLSPRPTIRPGDLLHRTLLDGAAARLPRPVRIAAAIRRDPLLG